VYSENRDENQSVESVVSEQLRGWTVEELKGIVGNQGKDSSFILLSKGISRLGELDSNFPCSS